MMFCAGTSSRTSSQRIHNVHFALVIVKLYGMVIIMGCSPIYDSLKLILVQSFLFFSKNA